VTDEVDATLAAGGSISGFVTGPNGGDANACVTVFDSHGLRVESGGTDDSGFYRVRSVPPGSYVVGFVSCNGASLASQFYLGAARFGEAIPVTVAANTDQPNINGQLLRGASISGTVTGPGTAPEPGVCVNAVDPTNEQVYYGGGDTRADGTYVIRGLAAGEAYTIIFDETCGFGSGSLATQYYNDSDTFAGAATVTVGAPGSTLTGIDAQLRRAPKAEVTSGPTGTITSRRPTFGFKAGPAGTTVQCSVDQGTATFGACSAAGTHQPAADLADGAYTFRVRSTIDGRSAIATRQFTVDGPDAPAEPIEPTQPTQPTGPTGPQPGSDQGATDTTAPAVKIEKGPSGKTTDRTPKFVFSSNEPGSVFACAVDDKKAQECNSPTTLKKLGLGKHTFTVVAADRAGNFSKPVSVKFKVKKKKKKRR
jgi:hypothetical protein